MAKEVVIICGPGGVGKTTISASLAATAAARLGGRVLVLTVDPARRLADALGIGGLGNVAPVLEPHVHELPLLLLSLAVERGHVELVVDLILGIVEQHLARDHRRRLR